MYKIKRIVASTTFVLLLVGGMLAPATQVLADETTVSYEEYAVPSSIELPSSARSPIILTDDLTGLEVPLTGKGVVSTSGRISIVIPQLPTGGFTVSWPGGKLFVDVLDAGEKRFDYVTRQEQDAPNYYYLLVLAVGLPIGIWLLVRKRKAAASLVCIGAAILSSALWLSTSETPPLYGQLAWDVCDMEQQLDIQINCKVENILDHISNGEFAMLKELVATNKDPACHEAAHRASFHTWRTTRDAELAKSILIPGCADGLIHGIAESIATFTSDKDLVKVLLDFCTSAKEQFQIRACLHGAGHATIWRTNGDILRAWDICKEMPPVVPPDINVYDECLGSSVMEWSDRWGDGNRRGEVMVWPKVKEPMEICLQGPNNYLFRSGCYMGTNHRTGNASHAAKWCLTQEIQGQLDACFSAIGENLPYYETPLTTIELTPSMAVNHAKNCELASTATAQNACVTAMSRVFVSWKVSKDLGNQVCRALSIRLLPACLDGIKQAETSYEQRGLVLP